MSPPVQLDHTVGVADLIVVCQTAGRITTHALGSCIGVSIHDPVAGVAGMLHYMLPSPTDPDRAEKNQAMFATTGIPALFRQAYDLGAVKERLVVCVAGGATLLHDGAGFQIGRRNHTMLRKLFFKNNIVVAAEEVGGSDARTMRLELDTGRALIRCGSQERILWSRSKSA